MTSVGDCREITYHEPTPMWYHSYSYDSQGQLKRSSELVTRREVLLRKLLPEVPQLWEVRHQAEMEIPNMPKGVCMMDVKDARHHAWNYQSETSSQTIGWFADPKRLPKCMLREWPKYYANV